MVHVDIKLQGHGKEVIIGGVDRNKYEDIVQFAFDRGLEIDDVFTQWNYLSKATDGDIDDVFDMGDLCCESGAVLKKSRLEVSIDGKKVAENFDPLLLGRYNEKEVNGYMFDDTKVSVYFESSENGLFLDESMIVEDFAIEDIKLKTVNIRSEHGTEILITHVIYKDKVIEMSNTKTVFNGFNMNLYDPMEDSYELD